MHHREPPDIYLLILPTFTTIVKTTGKTPIGWLALALHSATSTDQSDQHLKPALGSKPDIRAPSGRVNRALILPVQLVDCLKMLIHWWLSCNRSINPI
jgi:hypothetical protein